MANRI
jgi:hypothetical protein